MSKEKKPKVASVLNFTFEIKRVFTSRSYVTDKSEYFFKNIVKMLIIFTKLFNSKFVH